MHNLEQTTRAAQEAMAHHHTVIPGESIASIAELYGFFAKILWEHPENATLKRLRKDPRILSPGDRIYIPDKTPKEVSAVTERIHRFRLRGIPATFRLTLRINGVPLEREEYLLRVDGRELHGQTNRWGLLEEHIPPAAKVGELVLSRRGIRVRLNFGTLPPVTEPGGVRERLRNLGFRCDTEEGTREALLRFQRWRHLPETGRPDEATCQALLELHDQR